MTMAQHLKPDVYSEGKCLDAANAITPILIAQMYTDRNEPMHREATIYDDPAEAYTALDKGQSVAIRIRDGMTADDMRMICKNYDVIALNNNFAHAMKVYFRHVPVSQGEFFFTRTDIRRPLAYPPVAFGRDIAGHHHMRTDALYKNVKSNILEQMLLTSDVLLSVGDLFCILIPDEHLRRDEIALIRIDCVGGILVKFSGDAWTPVNLKPGAMTVRNVFESATPVLRDILRGRHEAKNPALDLPEKTTATVCHVTPDLDKATHILRTGGGVAIDMSQMPPDEIDGVLSDLSAAVKGGFRSPVLRIEIDGVPKEKVDALCALLKKRLEKALDPSIYVQPLTPVKIKAPGVALKTTEQDKKWPRGGTPFVAHMDDFAFLTPEQQAQQFLEKNKPDPILDLDGHDIRMIDVTFRDAVRACEEDGEDRTNSKLRVAHIIHPLAPGYTINFEIKQARGWHHDPMTWHGVKDHVATPWVFLMTLTRPDTDDVLAFGKEIKPWW